MPAAHPALPLGGAPVVWLALPAPPPPPLSGPATQEQKTGPAPFVVFFLSLPPLQMALCVS